MRVTGTFVAELLGDLAARAQVGVNCSISNTRARRGSNERGAVSCYWDYAPSFGRGPFRNVVCLSVNDAVLHGLPHDYALRDGDLLSMDIAVSIDGSVADSARSVIVGTPAGRGPAPDLRHRTGPGRRHRRGAARQPPRRHLRSDRRRGHRVRLPGPHRVRRTRAGPPHARRPARPQPGRPGRGLRLRPGLTLALEPRFARGTDKIIYDPDGWTIRSRRRLAHRPSCRTTPVASPTANHSSGDQRARRPDSRVAPEPMRRRRPGRRRRRAACRPVGSRPFGGRDTRPAGVRAGRIEPQADLRRLTAVARAPAGPVRQTLREHERRTARWTDRAS